MAFPKLTLMTLVALVATVQADHVVTFINNCPFELTPVYKGGHENPGAQHGPTIGPGKTGSVTLPELWESGRIYAQDPLHSCAEPDGGNCTLSECSFGAPDANGNLWRQCNISLVSGYNVPTSLGYVGGKDASCSKTFRCLKKTCASTEAYLTGDGAASCSNCISQCNTANVGLRIEWCPSGSVIPDMGQKNNDPPKSDPPKSDPPKTTPPKSDPPKTDPPKSDPPKTSTEPPKSTPAFPGNNGSDNATKGNGGASNVAPTPAAQPPKRCSASRLDLSGKKSRLTRRGKLHFVGHYMGSASH